MEFATTTELNQHTNNVLRRVLEDKEDIVEFKHKIYIIDICILHTCCNRKS